MTRRDALLLVRDLTAAGLLQRAMPALLLLPEVAEAIGHIDDVPTPDSDLSQPPEKSVQDLQELVDENTYNLMNALTDVSGSIANLFPAGAPTSPFTGDAFAFLSISLRAPLPLAEPEVEAIDVVGFSSEKGPYTGAIGASGVNIGTETNNVERYRGTEAILYPTGIETGGITISGANVGLEVPFLAGGGVGAGTYTSGGRAGQYVSGHIEVFSTLSASFGFGIQIF